jgi:hypothetical protein
MKAQREAQTRLRHIFEARKAGKVCARCRSWFPAESFRPDASVKSGLSSWCRLCISAAAKEWREQHADSIDAYNERRRLEYAERQREARRRTCSECGEEFTGRPDRQTCSPECRKRR